MTSHIISPDGIRAAFSDALSAMYRAEIPLYGTLIDIVATVNAHILEDGARAATEQTRGNDLVRLGAERHGAIRLGTAAELSIMRRAFAVLGMYPVGYYDLASAGVPVHATAFRPTDPASLDRNPFRVFTSLLRIDAIDDAALRTTVREILAGRQIFNARAMALIEQAETDGGLDDADAEAFVGALLQTFRWHSDALVDAPTYRRLNHAHRLVADVVSFRGPHINHLTPRTLDIDAAQTEMHRRGIAAKAVIEGPPRRSVPILLRQTSFKALEEKIRFVGQAESETGSHTARFGEVEQRGAALTHKGRALYDRLLDAVREDGGAKEDYASRLALSFAAFPDDEDALRRQRLAYFRYSVADASQPGDVAADIGDIDALIDAGRVRAEPIGYEDFLPVSAAGIFQSNLGEGDQTRLASDQDQKDFEAALGVPVIDPFALYEAIERGSIEGVLRDLHAAAAVDIPA